MPEISDPTCVALQWNQTYRYGIKTTMKVFVALSLVFVIATAFQPSTKTSSVVSYSRHQKNRLLTLSEEEESFFSGSLENTVAKLAQNKFSVAAPSLLALLPLQAVADDGSAGGGQIVSALTAYGHYLSLFVIVGCLVTERLTVRANMSDEEEDRLAIADTTLGIAGFLLAYTGYLRTTADWGKGFDYYAHEPVFWLKILFVAIFGAVSFFPTTKIIQRSIAKRNGELVPMSEDLASRMTSLINAELLMVGSIPLTATFMARGVGYSPDFPWPFGAGACVLALGGLGFKYVKEALEWEEPPVVVE